MEKTNEIGRLKKGASIASALIILAAFQACAAEEIISGLDIAKETMSYIDAQKAPDGNYYYMKECSKENCTTLPKILKQSNSWVSLAKLGLYQATGEGDYLASATDEMDKFLQFCPLDVELQNRQFECIYCGVQLSLLYDSQSEKDSRYLSYFRFNGTKAYDYSMKQEMVAIISREMAMGYRYGLYDDIWQVYHGVLTNDYYDASKQRVWVGNNRGFNLTMGKCWNDLAYLELYKTLKQSDQNKVLSQLNGPGGTRLDVTVGSLASMILANERYYFDNVKLGELSKKREFFVVPLNDIEPCTESLLTLYDITGDERYKNDAISLLQTTLDYRWDSKRRPLHTGDGGFIVQGCRQSGEADGRVVCYNQQKALNDNAYFTYLFSKVKDHGFRLGGLKISYLKDASEDPGYSMFWSRATTTSTIAPTSTTTLAAKPVKPAAETRILFMVAWLMTLTILLVLAVLWVYSLISPKTKAEGMPKNGNVNKKPRNGNKL